MKEAKYNLKTLLTQTYYLGKSGLSTSPEIGVCNITNNVTEFGFGKSKNYIAYYTTPMAFIEFFKKLASTDSCKN